jgi:hypothetical protein
MRRVRKRTRVALILGIASGLGLAALWGVSPGRQDFELGRLDRLVLRLQNEGYVRSLDRNDFSLDYRVRRPATVVVVVRTTPRADGNVVKKLIGNARELILGRAKEDGLGSVSVEVDERNASP